MLKTLKQMHPTKASSLDGMPPLFFQHHWHIVSPSTTKVNLSALNSGTYITLILKKSQMLTIVDYRPINLCNVLYKLISKVITNRLQVVLPSLISDFQSTFIPERQIMDNILVAYEVIFFLKRKNKGNEGYMSRWI